MQFVSYTIWNEYLNVCRAFGKYFTFGKLIPQGECKYFELEIN